MPEVSIIIPVYNKEQYLQQAFESIRKQGIEDYEIIAVNNCSTDHSLQILNELAEADHRIRVIDCPRKGVSCARNAGLHVATGNWIQFLDADDYLSDGFLKKALATAKENSAEIFFSNFDKVNADGDILEVVSVQEAGQADQETLCRLFIQYQYHNGFFGFISNKLISRELLEKSKAEFPEDITLAEDLDFYVQLYSYVGRAYFLPEKSFYYLQTEENYLNRDEVDYYAQMRINLHIIDWFIKSGYYEENQEVLDKRIADYAYALLFDANERQTGLREAYQYLISTGEICSCLKNIDYSGFKKKVINAVINENYSRLESLFRRRDMLRNIYRTGVGKK